MNRFKISALEAQLSQRIAPYGGSATLKKAMPVAVSQNSVPFGEVFDPSHYPRTYRVSTGSRVTYCLLGALMLVGGLVGVWYFGTGHETKTAIEAIALAAVCLAFVVLGAAIIIYMLTTKVVLTADAIVSRDFLGVRKLRREDIAGRRSQRTRTNSTLVLVPRRPGIKTLKLNELIQRDSLFNTWLDSLPDLDAQDLARSQSEIIANRELGRTPEERARRLAVARKLANGLTGISVMVCVWGFVYPKPYEVVVISLAALPLVALALKAKAGSLYQVVGWRNDARANLAITFIGPTLALLVRAFQDIRVLDWTTALMAAAALGVAITVVIAASEKKLRHRGAELLAMLVLSGIYGYGVVAEGNMLLDESEPQIFEVTVLGKRVSKGKSTHYHLRLAPWGPRGEEDDITVSRTLYASAETGKPMCILLRAGALKIRWFAVMSCRK